MSDVMTLGSRDPAALARRLGGEQPADIAEALNRAKPKLVAGVLAHLPEDEAVEVLNQPELRRGGAILSAMEPALAARLLDGMAADRAASIVRQLRLPVRTGLLGLVTAETRGALDRLLPHAAGCVGAIMTTEFVSVPADWTVGQTLDHIRAVERSRETVYAIYVVDPASGVLLRALPLRRLIAADLGASVFDAAPRRAPVTVRAEAPLEDAIDAISKYNFLAVPVVDATGHVIGIVTVDDAMDALYAQQTAQVQTFGGMEALDAPYMQVGFLTMIRKRAGWLCVLFLAEMLTASAMQTYEHALERAIVLSLFIPLIMSSGGNSGSQASSLLIRAIALEEVRLGDWWKVLLRELPAGLLLGTILGALGALRITVWQMLGLFDYGPYWALVALTITLTLIGIVTFGSVVGSALPFIAKRLGFDPATASGPFVATMVDVTGIVIYFSIATIVLRGTML